MPDWPSDIVDRIYEAAVIPELWVGLLDTISDLISTNGGSLFAVDGASVRYLATEGIAAAMDTFVKDGWSARNTRVSRVLANNYSGFITDLDLVTREEWENDPFYRDFLRPCGCGWCAGTVIMPPSGQLIVFDFERSAAQGPVGRQILEALDVLRPHLARSALTSTLLGLQRARSTTELLGQLGLAAAVMGSNARAVAVNSQFEKLNDQIVPRAHGGLAFLTPSVDRRFRDSLTRIADLRHSGVRSFPVPAQNGSQALVAHLLPIKRSANDIFDQAQALLIMTPLTQSRLPSADLLSGLFDLTAAESALARSLLGGATINEVAAKTGPSRETLRAQLKSIFSKTGTNRQSALVGLLSGVEFPVGHWPQE